MGLKDRVDEYVKGDRQWFRDQRMAHARMQMKRYRKEPDVFAFWREVLARNESKEFRNGNK